MTRPARRPSRLSIESLEDRTAPATLQAVSLADPSLSPPGTTANGESWGHAISSNGRYVAFYSYASNLVPGDTNGNPDAFRKDLVTGEIVRVSTDPQGNQAVYGSGQGISISADGRYVAFDGSFGYGPNSTIPHSTYGGARNRSRLFADRRRSSSRADRVAQVRTIGMSFET